MPGCGCRSGPSGSSLRRRLRRLRGRRRGCPRALAVGPLSQQLPPSRPDESDDHLRRPAGQGAAGAGLRVRAPPGRRADGACARGRAGAMAASRARSRAARESRKAHRAGERIDSVGAWRNAFLHAPYLRDSLVACGVLSDTFETAITWDRFPDFHAEVMETARKAVAAACGAPAEGPARRGSAAASPTSIPTAPPRTTRCWPRPAAAREVEQWDEIKAAVSETINDLGGTITHHHAVGRDHRPWYDRQRPEPFAAALRAAKSRARPEGHPQPRRAGRPLASAERHGHRTPADP